MSITECPHCFFRVVPQSDGSCPACGKNTIDETTLAGTHTAVRLTHGQELPAICWNCGDAATTNAMIFVSRAGENDNTSVFGKFLLSLINSWVANYVATRSIEHRMTFGIVVFPIDDLSRRPRSTPSLLAKPATQSNQTER